jgi:hypothetical protein
VDTEHRTRQKLLEWARRYLPCEIVGTVAEIGGAAAAYQWTGSWAVAAVAATVCASVGYYSIAYVNAVRWLMPQQPHRHWMPRLAIANVLALRSVAVEFGPAEVIDSLAMRPAAYYLAPTLTGNMAAGLILGKVLADIGFYACAIFSYEKFKTVVAVRDPARTDRLDERGNDDEYDEFFDALKAS